MTTSKGRGTAPDASVNTEPADPRPHEAATAYVEQLEQERDLIKAKLDGMKASLAAKNDEIKAAKAAAREA